MPTYANLVTRLHSECSESWFESKGGYQKTEVVVSESRQPHVGPSSNGRTVASEAACERSNRSGSAKIWSSS